MHCSTSSKEKYRFKHSNNGTHGLNVRCLLWDKQKQNKFIWLSGEPTTQTFNFQLDNNPANQVLTTKQPAPIALVEQA